MIGRLLERLRAIGRVLFADDARSMSTVGGDRITLVPLSQREHSRHGSTPRPFVAMNIAPSTDGFVMMSTSDALCLARDLELAVKAASEGAHREEGRTVLQLVRDAPVDRVQVARVRRMVEDSMRRRGMRVVDNGDDELETPEDACRRLGIPVTTVVVNRDDDS